MNIPASTVESINTRVLRGLGDEGLESMAVFHFNCIVAKRSILHRVVIWHCMHLKP